METVVRIPPQLRAFTKEADEVTVLGNTVREVFAALSAQFAGIGDRLLDDKGVRRHINVFVGDEDIRFLDGLDTQLKAGDKISIIPAIAGG